MNKIREDLDLHPKSHQASKMECFAKIVNG